MGELLGLLFVIPMILGAYWVYLETRTGIRKVGKTMRAIDKWSDDQLTK